MMDDCSLSGGRSSSSTPLHWAEQSHANSTACNNNTSKTPSCCCSELRLTSVDQRQAGASSSSQPQQQPEAVNQVLLERKNPPEFMHVMLCAPHPTKHLLSNQPSAGMQQRTHAMYRRASHQLQHCVMKEYNARDKEL